MRQKIFISFSSKDKKAALTLCNAIESRGYSCWISTRDVGPGENFQEAIVQALANAPLMILVFSSNANNSGEIKKEIALASQNQMIVIPFRIEDVVPGEAFRYEFATRQWIDAFEDWERAIGQLLAQIIRATEITGTGESQSVASSQSSLKPSGQSQAWKYAAGAATLIILLGTAFYLRSDFVSKTVPAPAPQQTQTTQTPSANAKDTASSSSANIGAPNEKVRTALTAALAAFDQADYVKALRLYRQAAAQGNAQAQYNVGYIYERGYGVPKDYAQALRWYQQAAQQGDAAGECALGVFYQNGLGGLVQDNDLALMWYQKAASQGYPNAVEAVSKIKAAQTTH